jgi:acetylornithine deacetylase/succinyl-diaminopimelate desuccinylase-like protein
MRVWKPLHLAALAVLLSATGLGAGAQQKPLPPISASDQLGPKPPVGSGGCSMAAPTCADVAPTIIHSALGPSPLGANIRHLTGTPGAKTAELPSGKGLLQWAVQAFRKAGVDEAHVEIHTIPAQTGASSINRGSRLLQQASVVATISGREEPDEYVILGAHLDSPGPGAAGLDDACDAALVIGAARAIHAAGVRPLRSIRFILFTGNDRESLDSWAYLWSHRHELDRADAAIIYASGDRPVTGYDLDGRKSLEAPLRKALAPAAQFAANHDTYAAELTPDSFDFLLEGVSTLVANPRASPRASAMLDLSRLRHNVALVAITAYSIADLPERLSPRQTRPEIEQLIRQSGLENEMKSMGIWPEWERGRRGRRQ